MEGDFYLIKKLNRKNKKIVICYKNIYMWCVFNGKIVKTIYPIDNADKSRIKKLK
jgi:hypothetical protein